MLNKGYGDTLQPFIVSLISRSVMETRCSKPLWVLTCCQVLRGTLAAFFALPPEHHGELASRLMDPLQRQDKKPCWMTTDALRQENLTEYTTQKAYPFFSRSPLRQGVFVPCDCPTV